ncbi:MAG TPA: hypothetical protein VGF76_19090 [Polyangiaceae bacterium]
MIHSVRRVPVSLAVAALIAALSSVACNKSEKSDDSASTAESVSSAEPGGGKKHELPPAAFEACTGKAAGDACTVQFRDKQIEAKCAAAPDGRLACHPQRGEHKKPE